MPMTARQIVKYTPRSRKDASLSARIPELKKGKLPNGSIIFKAKVKTTRTAAGVRKPPPPMYTYITTAEINPKGYCIVSCSCEDFCFTWEYTLAKKGAARIEYSNGESSKDRNPAQIPGACKHVYALLDRLIDKGRI